MVREGTGPEESMVTGPAEPARARHLRRLGIDGESPETPIDPFHAG
jgi:hypothetical protein